MRSRYNIIVFALGVVLLVLTFSEPVSATCSPNEQCSEICISGTMCGSCGGHSTCNIWYGPQYIPETETCIGSQCNQYFCVSECMNP